MGRRGHSMPRRSITFAVVAVLALLLWAAIELRRMNAREDAAAEAAAQKARVDEYKADLERQLRHIK